jgi:glycosyltransferase involved in cell wall biosynthesis
MDLISFIVPAYNESLEIDATLKSIVVAARAVDVPFEIIVANDGSTDTTAAIARQAGARVIDVQLRQISAVRNAGARQAKGNFLFFVDADTRITAEVLRGALKALQEGAVGGGSQVVFSESVGWPVRFTIEVFSLIYSRLLRWAAGCFIFVQRTAFETVGGFDESLYASEEISLSIRLKRQGRFVVLREAVMTSARKLRLRSPWEIVPFLLRFIRYGPSMLRQRNGLDWWYDGQREKKPH